MYHASIRYSLPWGPGWQMLEQRPGSVPVHNPDIVLGQPSVSPLRGGGGGCGFLAAPHGPLMEIPASGLTLGLLTSFFWAVFSPAIECAIRDTFVPSQRVGPGKAICDPLGSVQLLSQADSTR